ncbi:hypothetical protein ASC89_02410 [Devosia sp. Root413D1]|uniref:hypothetical protein n=1 Tax=unclassified Devosia TaxID=196773 RepID=UPI0006F9154C|nr:hypothetical protein [Devosia sp. Root413D1]KQW85939.1 hypothetical protein ASC89_02410 [Devosia sp. Root413D1]
MVDKQSKRAPGGSPALSFLLAGAKALVVIAVIVTLPIAGWLGWRWYRPDHFFNPVGRQVHLSFLDCRDRGRCPGEAELWQTLMPEVFVTGEPRDEVMKRISDAGFERWVVENNSEYYSSSGTAFDPFPCSQPYYVRVTFDGQGKLVDAATSFSGTPSCL